VEAKMLVTFIGLLIPFVGMAVGAFVLHLMSRQAREERAYLNHERMAAIEKGLDVPLFDIKEPTHRTSPLHSALVTIATGIGLWLPVVHLGPGAWMWGFLVFLIGLAMLAHWFLGGKQQWEQERAMEDSLRQAFIDRLRAVYRNGASNEH
jgi:hypothetical protein